MSDNNSKKNRSGMADKIVAAVLVFLIFGAGTYGIAREAGSSASRADTGNSQIEQDSNNDGGKSGNGAEAVAVDINGGAGSGEEGEGQGQDPGQGQNPGQGQDPAIDANTQDGDNDGGQDTSDDGIIPPNKRKLSTADVRAAFGTGKSYYIAPVNSTGSGSYDIDVDTPIRRFPTLKAGVVSTIKAPASVYVMGFTDGGGWAQISVGGYIYYVPSWSLKGRSDNNVPSTASFVSGDVTDQNRFAAVMFTPKDPDSSQYVTKAQAPLKEDPSYAADDVDQLTSGTPVNVAAVSDNGWARVVKGGKTYYVNMAYLDPVTPPSQDQGQGLDTGNGDKDQAGSDQNTGDSGDGSGKDATAQGNGDNGNNGNNGSGGTSDKSSGSDKSDSKDSGSSGKSSDSGSDKSGTDKKDDTSSAKSGSGNSDKKSGGTASDKSGGNSDQTSDKSSDKTSDKSTDKSTDKSSDSKKDNKDSKYPGELMNSEAKKLLKLINDYRESNGVPKLKWSDGLAKAARTRSKEISVTSDSQNKHHKRPNGKDWYTVNPDLMYGENIAYGQKSAEEVFKAFKNSSAHNKTMLDPEYKIFAASLYKQEGTKYTYYWIQEFGY